MAKATKDKKAAPAPEPAAAEAVPAPVGGPAFPPTVSPTPSAAAAPAYQVLARRYRSKDFDELVGQEAISRTLRNAIRTGRTAHAYLFTGTRGVGKTSMARIFARALNADPALIEGDSISTAIMRGEDLDVIEIDAASNRGIDNARDLIAGAGLLPARSRYKIYIIDEVHMLTTPAFNALLKTMEEPPEHVKFILCTTEPQSVPATIQSRCQRFDFRSIPSARIAEHLRAVLAGEGWSAEERVVLQIARLANGSMRDALSLLERLLAASDPDPQGGRCLTWTLLEDIFGLPDESLFDRLLEAIGDGRPDQAIIGGGQLLERGLSIERALDLLAERFRWILLAMVCGPDTDLLEVDGASRATIAGHAERFAPAGPPGLVQLIALCDSVAAKARDSSSPRAIFDAALVRMAVAESFADAARLLAGGGGATAPKKPVARVADDATRVSARPPRPAPVPMQASPPSAVEPKPDVAPAEIDGAALWRTIEAAAASSPRDAAIVETLEYRRCDGRTLHVALRRGEAGAGYLAGQQEMLAEMLARLCGRRLEVHIEVASAPAPRAESPRATGIPDAIREHPVVRRVAELFDATIVDIRPRVRGGRSSETETASADHGPTATAGAEPGDGEGDSDV